MSTFPGSPKLVKGGIVLVDPETSAVLKVIPLQYNPDSLSRTLQVQGVSAEGASRSEALRLKGPPVETIKVEAEIDATDQLEKGEDKTAQYGVHPQLATLEMLIYPRADDMQANEARANSGELEIIPMQAPLTLFVWSKNRIVPVRLTDFSVTEEAFDPNLNPIRAKISLGMRVLSVDDIGFGHKGGSIYMSYQRNKEKLAGMSMGGALSELNIERIP